MGAELFARAGATSHRSRIEVEMLLPASFEQKLARSAECFMMRSSAHDAPPIIAEEQSIPEFGNLRP
jgi:hypothetical protein